MKNTVIIGIVLIVLGAAVLGFNYTYTTRDTVLQVGPITATAEREHTGSLPPILGWLLIGGGAGVLVFGLLKKN